MLSLLLRVFDACLFAWKYALLLLLAMAVTLVAFSANLLYLSYNKLYDTALAQIQAFFREKLTADLTERLTKIDLQIEALASDLGSLKSSLAQQSTVQATATQEMRVRFETLRESINATTVLLEEMSTRESTFGGLRKHRPSSLSASLGSSEDLPMTPLPTTRGGGDISLDATPFDSPISGYNSGPPSPNHSGAPPPPPPPPMPNFTFGMASFKINKAPPAPRPPKLNSQQLGVVVTLNEITQMRNRLRKVPNSKCPTP